MVVADLALVNCGVSNGSTNFILCFNLLKVYRATAVTKPCYNLVQVATPTYKVSYECVLRSFVSD